MEPSQLRRISLALAIVLAAGFLLATHRLWVPADPGVDENAYLVSGKLLARTGSPGFTPADPYSLVGKMWIGTREGKFYPKYPLGQPLLVALAVKAAGLRAAYWINPLLMTLALLGVFRLVREAAGSIAGLLGMIMMAASPVTLAETNDPDSHASSLCFTTWGMFLLLGWWRTGKLRHAALAGLLLGVSAITRYTEGLLLLPIGLVVLFRCGRRPSRRSLGAVAALAAGWLAPVAGQLLFNLNALHSLTGYDTTHESTAFSAGLFAHNGLLTARLLTVLGLPGFFLLGLLGLAMLAFREGRLAAVLWAWLLPNLFLYTSYYWALENDGVELLRFFLTVFPPLVLGAAWLLTRPLPGRLPRWAQAAAAFALVLAGAGICVREALPILARDRIEDLNVQRAAVATLANAPPGSAVLGPQEALLHLQFVGDYQLYSRNLFMRHVIAELGKIDAREPSALQPERARALFELLHGRGEADLDRLERDLMAGQLREGHRVFLIAPARKNRHWLELVDADLDALDGRHFATRQLAVWPESGGLDWQLLEVTAKPVTANR